MYDTEQHPELMNEKTMCRKVGTVFGFLCFWFWFFVSFTICAFKIVCLYLFSCAFMYVRYLGIHLWETLIVTAGEAKLQNWRNRARGVLHFTLDFLMLLELFFIMCIYLHI